MTDPHDAARIPVERWNGPWADDDPDANFKAEVAAHRLADPLHTLRNLSAHTGIPLGALVHYVLARWASEGSAGLLELGPTMVQRLTTVCEQAESAGTDEARLRAYHELRQRLEWLRYAVDHPEVYDR